MRRCIILKGLSPVKVKKFTCPYEVRRAKIYERPGYMGKSDTGKCRESLESITKIWSTFKGYFSVFSGDCFLHYYYFEQDVAGIFIPTVRKYFLLLLDG